MVVARGMEHGPPRLCRGRTTSSRGFSGRRRPTPMVWKYPRPENRWAHAEREGGGF